MSLAKRVAEEQGCALGTMVGYKYRFCDKTSNSTLIKYCTEGTLLRESLSGMNLNAYSVVILDEAHERTTNTDVLFGLMKKEMKRRPNLRVIVSSATLEAKKFSKFFNDAPIFNIEGRTFPVEILYRPSNVSDYFNASIATVIHIHTSEKPGDILLFLTGQDEIEQACEVLESHRRFIPDLIVLPIYSALQYSEQVKVFNSVPEGSRKVVISTNVAETSMVNFII
jgi:ATP-dependent RNA helicase DHX8/PRP22